MTMENAARQCGENEMTWFDAVDACTKNVVEVGACCREEVGQ
jgi:hypothetical protein